MMFESRIPCQHQYDALVLFLVPGGTDCRESHHHHHAEACLFLSLSYPKAKVIAMGGKWSRLKMGSCWNNTSRARFHCDEANAIATGLFGKESYKFGSTVACKSSQLIRIKSMCATINWMQTTAQRKKVTMRTKNRMPIAMSCLFWSFYAQPPTTGIGFVHFGNKNTQGIRHLQHTQGCCQ